MQASQVHSLPNLLTVEQKYWRRNGRVSVSITQQICRLLMLGSSNSKNLIPVLSGFLHSHQKQYPMLCYDWISSVLFNVAAMNEEYIDGMEDHLRTKSNHHPNQPNTIQQLMDQCRDFMEKILNDAQMVEMVVKKIAPASKESTEGNHVKIIDRQEKFSIMHGFFTTLQYLLDKYDVGAPYQKQLPALLQKYEEGGELRPLVKGQCNRLLFACSQSTIPQLHKKLESNYNGSLLSIASLIDANYYELETPRSLFQVKEMAIMTGENTLVQIFHYLIKNSTKNNVFSDKMADGDRLMQLALAVLEYRHLNVFMSWFEKVYVHLEKMTNIDAVGVSKIVSFLYSIPMDFPDYISLLRKIHAILNEKYPRSAAIQIMKKLILNRFLLNPNLYFDYTEAPDSSLPATLNNIRLLFHPKKLSPELQATGERLHELLDKVILTKSSEDTSENLQRHTCEQTNKNSIYRLDKQLYEDYQMIYDDFLVHNNYEVINEDASYQLSFSFLRKNEGDASMNRRKDDSMKNVDDISKYTYPRDLVSPTSNPENNNSLNMILDNLRPSNPGQRDLGSPTSIKSRKTLHTEFTDHHVQRRDPFQDMITEMVNKRRQLGAARRAIDQRRDKKKKRRQKWSIFMNRLHEDFQNWRRQLETDANRIRINMDLL